MSGPTSVFGIDGHIEVETFYKGGKKGGAYKEWDKHGKLIKFYILEQDKLVKTIIGM